MKLLLLLFTGLKLGKVLLTGGTMLLSILVYATIWGWPYAAGFVLLIFVHEMGHYVAARHKGLDVGAPMFIPFVGAWINLKQIPHDAEVEAYVGLAGPAAGTAGALACYFLARQYDSGLFYALAYAGCFINLFNLIPLSPLDGGRITAVLSPRIWLLGVPALVAMFFYQPSPVLIMIAVLAVPSVLRALHYDPQAPENQAYYAISAEAKLFYTCFYLGLSAYLALMTYQLHGMLGARPS